MKKYKVIIAAAVASALSFSAQANPLPLSGSIGFSGNAGLGGQTWPSLTFVNITGATVTGSTLGSYLPLIGKVATFNNPVSLQVNNTPTLLFSVTDVSGDIWEINALSVTVAGYDNVFDQWQAKGGAQVIEWNSLHSVELGVSSLGTYNFSISRSFDSYAFSGTAGDPPPGVPDGGLTVCLLGGALVALQMFRRKLVS